MARPTHIPVCRLHIPLGVNQSTAWRRAQRGDFGPITRDNDGRQQIEVAQVEQVEGITIAEDALRTAALPRAYGRHLEPLAVQLEPWTIQFDNSGFLSRDGIAELIKTNLLIRDAQWRRFLARIDACADILETKNHFVGDDHEQDS